MTKTLRISTGVKHTTWIIHAEFIYFLKKIMDLIFQIQLKSLLKYFPLLLMYLCKCSFYFCHRQNTFHLMKQEEIQYSQIWQIGCSNQDSCLYWDQNYANNESIVFRSNVNAETTYWNSTWFERFCTTLLNNHFNIFEKKKYCLTIWFSETNFFEKNRSSSSSI